jgi:flagellar M-ring protein FliF
MVNMPSESLFVLSSDETEATASVMVEIKDGGTLTNEEVQAIANLILKSVSGLKMENISIVDSNMNLYDVTGESGEEYSTTQYDLTQLTKETYEQQVLSVLTPVFGKDNVSAAVNVVLNFDQETVSSVAFDTPLEDDTRTAIRSRSSEHGGEASFTKRRRATEPRRERRGRTATVWLCLNMFSRTPI